RRRALSLRGGECPIGHSAPLRSGRSHLRLTTRERGEHHITVPRHAPLRIGTLAAILAEVARHHEVSRDAVMGRLFRQE
ncbi:MAG TPA: hypothetical protein VF431_04105, partial [Candidatus Methylomirabilis sp.]